MSYKIAGVIVALLPTLLELANGTVKNDGNTVTKTLTLINDMRYPRRMNITVQENILVTWRGTDHNIWFEVEFVGINPINDDTFHNVCFRTLEYTVWDCNVKIEFQTGRINYMSSSDVDSISQIYSCRDDVPNQWCAMSDRAKLKIEQVSWWSNSSLKLEISYESAQPRLKINYGRLVTVATIAAIVLILGIGIIFKYLIARTYRGQVINVHAPRPSGASQVVRDYSTLAELIERYGYSGNKKFSSGYTQQNTQLSQTGKDIHSLKVDDKPRMSPPPPYDELNGDNMHLELLVNK